MCRPKNDPRGPYTCPSVLAKRKNKAVKKPAKIKASKSDSLSISPKNITSHRELGVIFGLLDIDSLTGSSSDQYIKRISSILPNQNVIDDSSLLAHSWEEGAMPNKIKETLKANALLGQRIKSYYTVNNKLIVPSDITWVAADKTKNPADIQIGNDLWSLKENSDILKNSSAGGLANIFLGRAQFKRGQMHILDTMAREKHHKSLIYAIQSYNKENPQNKIVEPGSYKEWSKVAMPERKKLRDWITKNSSPEFKGNFGRLKQLANEEAGIKYRALILEKGFSDVPTGLILGAQHEYHYAKINDKGKTDIGKVPDASEISKNVHIKDVQYQAGNQLNIMIHFANMRHEELSIMGEMRYSHGQFIGTPECKMKIVHSGVSFVEFLS